MPWGFGGWGLGAWGADTGDLFGNLGFEIEGPSPGEAESWDFEAHAPATEYAPFGPNLGDSIETFDWFETYTFVLGLTDTTTMLFAIGGDGLGDPTFAPKLDHEGFDSGWPGTDTYTQALQGVSISTAELGPDEVEDFEWGTPL